MLTNDKGHVAESYQYDVYGNAYNGQFSSLGQKSDQGSIFGQGFGYGNGKSGNVYGFTGQGYEPEAGLYAFTYRHYNPQTMRWQTLDPIKDGLNWYEYCGGDPVNWVDPMGLRYVPEDVDYGPHRPTTTTIKVTSVITSNYEGGEPYRWGMSGSQTVTYSSPTLSKTFTIDYVRWAEDRAKPGEEDPGYEYPAEPGTFPLSYNPDSKKYQIKVEHPESGLYLHRSYAHISEGCPLLGANADIEDDILSRLKSGEELEIELEVIDKRAQEEKEKYPLPYTLENECGTKPN